MEVDCSNVVGKDDDGARRRSWMSWMAKEIGITVSLILMIYWLLISLSSCRSSPITHFDRLPEDTNKTKQPSAPRNSKKSLNAISLSSCGAVCPNNFQFVLDQTISR